MSKPCGLEPSFVDKMSAKYDSAKTGDIDALTSFKLYEAVALQAITENPECKQHIYEHAKGKLKQDMVEIELTNIWDNFLK